MIIEVNGVSVTVDDSKKDMTLLKFLREELALKGTKNGCGIGSCGTCTVLADMKAVRSCVTPLSKCDGKKIITIEGMALPDGTLHPIQQAFLDAGAIQCGFCTPGMVLNAQALLYKNPTPRREEIREAFKNVLCRCTGYQQIVDAVELAAERMKQP